MNGAMRARAAGWRFPASRPLDLPNGLRVRLVDMPGRLVATVAAVIDMPTAVEEQGHEGAVAAYAAMTTAPVNGAVRAGVRIGAMITSGADHRGPKVLADCPVSDLPALLDALGSMIFDFRPDAMAFAAWRRQAARDLAFAENDPSAMANRLLNESVLDSSGRYARPLGGSADSSRDLTVADVAALHQRWVTPSAVTVIVVGDLAPVDAEAAARNAFGGYAPRDRPAATDVPARGRRGPRLIWRPVPGARQTRVMVGCFAIDRRDPRWPSARVVAEVLGAGPDAVLNRVLRERLGVSYGVDVRFVPYAEGGIFLLSGSVTADRAPAAVTAIKDVLDASFERGLDAELVEQVRDRMVTGAPEIYETSLGVAQQHAELVSCGLAESFIDDHLAALRELDAARVSSDLRSLVVPDRLHAVVVGPFDPDSSAFGGLVRQ